MQTIAQATCAKPADQAPVILKRTDEGAWTRLEMNMLRQSGVRVEEVEGSPDRIAVTGKPRGGRSFGNVLYHSKFEIVERESPAAALAS